MQLNIALDEQGTIAFKVKLVELRYLLGCTADENADLMKVSKATEDCDLKLIKSWLYTRLYPVIPEQALARVRNIIPLKPSHSKQSTFRQWKR